MKSLLRGFTSLETLIMMVVLSMIFLVSYSSQVNAFRAYREMINRERAILLASETLEQFEAMKLTRMQQNYPESWNMFLGTLAVGQPYNIIVSPENMSAMSLQQDTKQYVLSYEGERDFFTQLERRIFLDPVAGASDQRKVIVSVYWGIAGQYQENSLQQIRMQAVFANHVNPSYVQ